jgi:RNA polymerase sigma-70 factor (family 1)
VYQNNTEKVLLEQVASNDEKAFKVLFNLYNQRLYQYITCIIKSQQVAEELVLDVFMKIWLGKELIIQIENFEAFIFRVAHNKAIDFLRSVAKDPKFQDLMWYEMHGVTGDRADSSILQHEYETKLREAVELLSPQRKKVYVLSRQMEMTHDQIAVHLGLSKRTVNNHIFEAQRLIRTYLSDSFDIAFLMLLACNQINIFDLVGYQPLIQRL